MPKFGSSPLTRGTHNDPAQFVEAVRFIPAYAGNSQRENSFTLQSTVHPRLRGELNFLLLIKQQSIGSSPLTRGTREGARKNPQIGAVHPRLRGELT